MTDDDVRISRMYLGNRSITVSINAATSSAGGCIAAAVVFVDVPRDISSRGRIVVMVRTIAGY
jgi:hypothetical protein